MSEPQDGPAGESSIRPPEPGSLPPRPRAGRSAYAQRAAERTTRRTAALATAARVCAQLNEANVAAVARLIEFFGPVLVEGRAARAQALLAAADAAPPDPILQMRNGQPRSLGGVFFQLMQMHATELGLYWPALALPPPPAPMRTGERGQRTRSGLLSGLAPTPGAAPGPAAARPAAPVSAPAATAGVQETALLVDRPARAKLTVVGVLAGPPQDVAGPVGPLVELPFRCAMTPTLPRGLPVLGPTRVSVWCTPKQWSKVREGLTRETRLIAEGEAALAQDATGTPLLRLVCLNLRTLEQTQAGRMATEQPDS